MGKGEPTTGDNEPIKNTDSIKNDPPKNNVPPGNFLDEVPGAFSSAWKRFVQSLRRLLASLPDERSLDPFLALRDTVLDASEREDVVWALEQGWRSLHSPNSPQGSSDGAHLILMELSAFPPAVELAEAEKKADKPFPKKRLLSIAKTTLDSVRDLYEDLPFPAKAILKVLGEVIDFFRGE